MIFVVGLVMTKEPIEQKEKRELIFLRERERTRSQLYQLSYNMAWHLVRISFVYWVFSLSFVGLRGIYVGDELQAMSAILYGVSTLWAVSWFVFNDCYTPIEKDAARGFGLISIKLKTAIDGWRSVDKNNI
jgi:hypothetical protein